MIRTILLGMVVLLSFALTSPSFAYKVGDRIDSSLARQLNMAKGKVYVINFFASWCPSCKVELPLINRLAQQGTSVIGINIDENASKGRRFVKSLNLKFKIIYDNDNKLVERFNPVGVPAIYFVENSRVMARKFGAVNRIDSYILNTINTIMKIR